MIMRKLLCILIIFNTTAVLAQNTDSLLILLTERINEKELYVSERLIKIDSLKRQLSNKKTVHTLFSLYHALYTEYGTFKYDSAFAYADKLIKLAYEVSDQEKINEARLQLGFTLLSAGMFKEAFDSLSIVEAKQLKDSAKIAYYSLMGRAYYDLQDYNVDHYYSGYYNKLAIQYIDSAKQICDSNSYSYLYLNGLKALRNYDWESAENSLNKLIEEHTLTPHEFAIVASTLSYINLTLGDTTKAINLLAKASVFDVETATKETSALLSLSRILFEQGDLDHADLFIKQAMDDATFYGAKQRKIQVGTLLPVIAAVKLSKVEAQKELLLFYVIVLVISVIVTGIFISIVIYQYKKLKKADNLIKKTNAQLKVTIHKLEEANKIKDEYIGYYFDVHSDHLNKTDKFKQSIERKLMDRKLDDVRYILSTFNLKKEREQLYDNFDRVFLKLFPAFIDHFNALFREEDQVKLEGQQFLNTELRIFALIRIGISDSDKIAKILGYSLNTIYTYKNKVKSKSIIPNEQFEQEIMKIKTI